MAVTPSQCVARAAAILTLPSLPPCGVWCVCRAGGADGDTGIYKLFVGQIPPFTSEDTLRATFQPFGQITDVVILKDRHTGAHKGCGFVCFASRPAADHAIAALADKVKLPNAKREMIVRYAGERPEEKEHKLYVCMLSRQSTEAEVRALFEPYGTLTEVFIIRSREGNQSKGAAFVKYTSKDDAQRAVDAIHDKVKDKDAPGLVQVRFAHTKEERAAHLSHVLGNHHAHPAHPAAAAAMQAAMMRGIHPSQLNPAFHHMAAAGYPGHPHHPHPSHPAAFGGQLAGMGKYGGQNGGGYGMYAQPGYAAAGRGPAAGEYGQLQGGYGANPPYGDNQQPANPQQPFNQPQPYYNAYHSTSPSPPQPGGGLKDQRGPDGANLFVYNVPESFHESDLTQLFSNFGSVLSTRIQRDLQTGVSKGFGFVSYDDASAAQSAIHALDGFSIGNKRLTVRVKTANPRHQYPRGGEY